MSDIYDYETESWSLIDRDRQVLDLQQAAREHEDWFLFEADMRGYWGGEAFLP